jgi:hypothetical protein
MVMGLTMNQQEILRLIHESTVSPEPAHRQPATAPGRPGPPNAFPLTRTDQVDACL